MSSDSCMILCRSSAGEKPLLLQALSVAPAAVWLTRALEEAGVKRFFVVCSPDWTEEWAACVPEGTGFASCEEDAAAFFAQAEAPTLVIDRPLWLSFAGARAAVSGESPRGEDTGVYRVAPGTTRREAVAIPAGGVLDLEKQGGFCLGQELARKDMAARLMADGVYLTDPAGVYVDPTVRVGAGTLLLPGTILRGNTTVGKNCQLGPNTMLTHCAVGDGVTINASQCEESQIGDRCQLGPYTHLRPHCVLGEGSKIGAFVQLKNCTLGKETKMAHLTYVGDSDVGDGCNFGCGTVTCNYDGVHKARTTIGNHVFIGCNTNLVAPVTVEDGAYTAAGTTVTECVPADALVIGRVRQTVKEGWAKRRREK